MEEFHRMEEMKKAPWLDIRLPKKAMEHLWDSINNSQCGDARKTLAGNISKSVYIKDKDSWFYENVLKEVVEYMYYKKSWDDYFDVHITKMKSHPKFYLKSLWVNYQKQYEFNPPHHHNSGNGFSFVVFMKIPTHWKEQHALPFSANSNGSCASDFQFLLGGLPEIPEAVRGHSFPLSPENEGRMLFFPAWVQHQVFPFYECEEERITISGNIVEHEQREISLDEKKQQVEEMEKQINAMKKNINEDASP